MPSYDYRCENDHWTTQYTSMAGRDDAPTCKTCGADTLRGIRGRRGGELQAEKDTERAAARSANTVRRVIRDLRCACGYAEDTVIVERTGEAFNDSPTCPSCTGIARYEVPAEVRGHRDSLLQKEITGGWFDRGAGRHFASKHDRREWMKQRGVECTEGADMMPGWRESERKAAALEDEHNANLARYNDDPVYRKAAATL